MPDASAIAIGDFSGNGRVDLAVVDTVVNGGQGGVTILMNNGDGTFTVLPTIAFGQANNGPYPSAIVAGNFTGDGHTDLAVADTGTDDVTVFLGNGDGTFQTRRPTLARSSLGCPIPCRWRRGTSGITASPTWPLPPPITPTEIRSTCSWAMVMGLLHPS